MLRARTSQLGLRLGLLVLSFTVLGSFVYAAQPAGLTIYKVDDYPLPGDTSRYDYQSYDPSTHRLYVAHLGMGVVRVFDTQQHALIGNVDGVPGVHGVIAVPELGRVYATATNANALAVIDPEQLQVVAMVPAGDYPDGLAYAPTVGKIYVSDEHGNQNVVIDAQTNELVTAIPLGGEVGNTQFDSGSGLIYAAVQTRNQIVSIDPTTDTVNGRFDTPGCDWPHGVAIDAEHRLLFAACQRNARLAVFDMNDMHVTATYDVGRSPDVLAFDPQNVHLYVAAEDGTLSAFVEDAFAFGQLQTVAAATNAGPNAHSVGLDTDTHHVFVPTLNILGQPVLREFQIDVLRREDD
jgi:YVTN family beta-propeller protein